MSEWRVPVVCRGYCPCEVDGGLVPTPLPTTAYGVVRGHAQLHDLLEEGWALAVGFTTDGQSVWICPACVARSKEDDK